MINENMYASTNCCRSDLAVLAPAAATRHVYEFLQRQSILVHIFIVKGLLEGASNSVMKYFVLMEVSHVGWLGCWVSDRPLHPSRLGNRRADSKNNECTGEVLAMQR